MILVCVRNTLNIHCRHGPKNAPALSEVVGRALKVVGGACFVLSFQYLKKQESCGAVVCVG